MAYVTDHAVLRYLQRHHGVDVEAIRAELTVRGIDTAAAFGCDTIKLATGERLKLMGDIVCTCLAKRGRSGNRQDRRGQT